MNYSLYFVIKTSVSNSVPAAAVDTVTGEAADVAMVTSATEITGAMQFQLAAFEQATCLLERQQQQISALQEIVE